jgi:hypothetical protein
MKKENPEYRRNADLSTNTKIEFGKLKQMKSKKRELTKTFGSEARFFGV